MKKEVLFCDLCPEAKEKLAVVSLVVSNGKKTNDVPLDLCERDHKKFMKFIQPRRRVKAQSMALPGPGRRNKRVDRERLNKAVLAAMPKGKTMSPQEIYGPMKESYWQVKKSLEVLTKEKLIERSGKGKFTKYTRR